MATSKRSMYLYKEILSAIRSTANQSNISEYKKTYGYCYINSLCGNQYGCDNEKYVQHLHYMGETYLCLLKSIRASKILYDRYKGGEDSVEKIANKVGFKLPPKISEEELR